MTLGKHTIVNTKPALEKDELLRDKAKMFERGHLYKRASSFKRFCLIASDVILFTLSVVLGFYFASGFRENLHPDLIRVSVETAISVYPTLFLMPMLLMLVLNGNAGHYHRFKGFWEEYAEFLKIVFIVAALTLGYLFLIREQISRGWLLTTWLLVLIIVPVGRIIVKRWMMHAGTWFTPTIVIGSGKNALLSALAIESNILMGFNVIALMDLKKSAMEAESISDEVNDVINGRSKTFPVFPFSFDKLDNLQEKGSAYLVLALEADDYKTHDGLIEKLTSTRFNMSIIPPLRGLPLLGTEVTPIFRHEVLHMRVRNNLGRKGSRLAKRIFDLIGSSILLTIFSPIFLYFSWKIRSDGGPAFFAQKRMGKGGKQFSCYKFRSMRTDAETVLKQLLASDARLRQEWEEEQKLKEDPRITAIGQFLRKFSIDELPQLWNVFKGDMSLVGPRPVMREELKRYGYSQFYYLETSPGITGLWQISGRNDLSYETRVHLDAWYVRNWSIWYDITILFKTIRVVITRDGAY